MKKTTISMLATLALLAACLAGTVRAGGLPASGEYDAASWKTMIPDSCTAFFDGCNTCRRAEGSEQAACTRMACANYQRPRCLDQPITEGTIGNTPFEGRLARFECDAGNSLRVYHDEYVSGDQRVRLAEGEIMLVDEQNHTAYRLLRERAASGTKYSDGELEFWEHGGEAMLRKDGERLYADCKVAG